MQECPMSYANMSPEVGCIGHETFLQMRWPCARASSIVDETGENGETGETVAIVTILTTVKELNQTEEA